MAETLPGAVFFGGWWGNSGQDTDAGLLPYTLGWWDPEEFVDIQDQVDKINAFLEAHDFLFINVDGDYEEANFSAFIP